jgi:hypothetical protein
LHVGDTAIVVAARTVLHEEKTQANVALSVGERLKVLEVRGDVLRIETNSGRRGTIPCKVLVKLG